MLQKLNRIRLTQAARRLCLIWSRSFGRKGSPYTSILTPQNQKHSRQRLHFGATVTGKANHVHRHGACAGRFGLRCNGVRMRPCTYVVSSTSRLHDPGFPSMWRGITRPSYSSSQEVATADALPVYDVPVYSPREPSAMRIKRSISSFTTHCRQLIGRERNLGAQGAGSNTGQATPCRVLV